MEIKKNLSGEATKEQIAMWKAKHGTVFEVIIDDAVCYLHKPDRNVISAAATLGQNDPMRFNEVLIENCWISGDEKIKTDNDYFFALVEKAEELLRFKTAEIKKL
ncbi:MAG: hypothetical protein LBK94_08630 [Prevotellaceae bacterium]|jgi:hypothetical protein|nr:hypothetical protein [Prevotellaceae bacterium]